MVGLFDPETRVAPPAYAERMEDAAFQDKRLGPVAGLRDKTLAASLAPLRDVVVAAAPLPASYDVTRAQPPFFSEFAYTELFGGLYVAPQSTEAACRCAAAASAADPVAGFDSAGAALARANPDKYLQAAAVDPDVRRVAFLPGTNLFKKIVSRDLLWRAMADDDGLFAKPHPLTDPETLRLLGREFGYHRVLKPDASGYAYLRQAEAVYVTASTQMGLYAALMGKPIFNIGVPVAESRGAYYPFYREIWGLEPAGRRTALTRMLNSPLSGVLHPDDPQAADGAAQFFCNAMAIRESLRPLADEYTGPQWSDAVMKDFA